MIEIELLNPQLMPPALPFCTACRIASHYWSRHQRSRTISHTSLILLCLEPGFVAWTATLLHGVRRSLEGCTAGNQETCIPNHASHMSLAARWKPGHHVWPLHWPDVSIGQLVLCEYMRRIALSASSQIACYCLVLLAFHLSDIPVGPGIPSGNAKGPGTAARDTEIAGHSEACQYWVSDHVRLGHLAIWNCHWSLVGPIA